MLKQEQKRFELIFIFITNFTIMAYKKYHIARTDYVTATLKFSSFGFSRTCNFDRKTFKNPTKLFPNERMYKKSMQQ